MSLLKSLENNALLKRILNAVIFGGGIVAVAKILVLLSNIITSRILGEYQYGQFSLINSTVTTFMTFAGLGIGASLTRCVVLIKSDDAEIGLIIKCLYRICFVASTLLSIFIFIFSKQLSMAISDSAELSIYLKIAAVTLEFCSLASLELAIMMGLEEFRVFALIQVVSCIFYAVANYILCKLYGTFGAISALTFMYFLQYLCCKIFNNRRLPKIQFDMAILRNARMKSILFSFTIPSFFAGLFVTPIAWISNSIITKYSGFEQLAYFSVALQWMTLLTYLPKQFNQVKPVYIDLYANKHFKKIWSIFLRITGFSLLIMMPIILGVVHFSKIIISLYEINYEQSIMPFLVMIGTSLIIIFQAQIGPIIEASGKAWYSLVINCIWGVALVAFSYIFRINGATGLSIAYFLSYSLLLVISLLLLVSILVGKR